jgi:hypothetical protein
MKYFGRLIWSGLQILWRRIAHLLRIEVDAVVPFRGKINGGRLGHSARLNKSLRNSPSKMAMKTRKLLEGPGTPCNEIRMKIL